MSRIKSKQLQLATAGDLLVGGASGFGTNLPIGTDTQVLTVVSGALAWATPSGGTGVFTYKGTLDAAVGTLPVTPANGDVYKITAAGDFGGNLPYNVNVNDFIVWDGVTWDKLDGTDVQVIGTANRVTVSGDSDVGYQVDIASTYAGQSSITTLGTISSGTWNGSTIGLAYGGTNSDLSTLTANQLVFSDGTSLVGAIAPTVTGTVLTWNGTAFEWDAAGAGTITGAANVGNLGVGVYSTVNAGVIELRNIAPGSNKLSVTLDGVNENILLDVVEANFDLANMGGVLAITQGGTGLTTIANHSVLVTNATDTLSAETATVAGTVLRYNGTSVSFSQVDYADIANTPTVTETGYAEVDYAGATVPTGTHVFTAFFTNTAISAAVFFNGIRLASTEYSISGVDLTLDIDAIGYSLEATDVISSDYQF